MQKTRKRLATLGIALALAVALAAVACGCGGTTITSPAQVVKQAIAAQGRLKSAKMAVDISIGIKTPQSLQATNLFYKGDGFYEQPDKSSLTLKSSGGQMQVIAIGDNAYVKTPGSSAWVKRKTASSPHSGTTPADVTNYLKYTRNLQMLDSQGDTYHLKFDLDMGRYAKVAGVAGVDPAVFKGKQAQLEVWVNKQDHYVQRVKMDFKGDLASAGVGDLELSTDLEFSQFNKPVTIEAPM